MGQPIITDKKVDGIPIGSGYAVCPGNHYLTVVPSGGTAGEATWQVPPGVFSWYGGINRLDFTYPSNMTSVTISARSSNGCGPSVYYPFFLQKRTSGCPGFFAISASPNPVEGNEITVKVIAADQSELTDDTTPDIDDVSLISSDGEKMETNVKEGKTIKLDVAALRRGLYYLKVRVGEEVLTSHIIIK